MEEQTKQVRITAVAVDSRSGLTYVPTHPDAAPEELHAEVAMRLISGGVAIEVSPEALNEKSVDELKANAEAANVDLAGKKGSKDEIVNAMSKGG